ncbi:MAG: amidohydrolase family protein [Gammaproteobacteria bacterium]|nr:amidohydrolase family protein [Gammaproteobacteria bacterium]
MRRLLLLFVGLFAAATVGVASTAFVNVNVIPMTTETVIEGQTVVVENGLIAAIGDVDLTPVPKDAELVDGTDRFLIPGLAEMHGHVPDIGTDYLDRVFSLFVANGVTTVRGMLGRPSHLALRQRLLDGDVFGPRLFTSGPSMNGNSVKGAADAERKVRAQYAAGYDFVKIHPGLSADEYAAIATTAAELGMPFAGHVPVAIGVEGALAAGMATIDHLDGYIVALMPADTDPSGGYGGFFDVLLAHQAVEEKIAAIAKQTADAGTWNVPTESLIEHLVSDISVTDLRNRPEMRYMPIATVEQWVQAKEQLLDERGFDAGVGARAIELRRKLIHALHEAGAGLLLGSDAPQIFNVPGFSLHHELGFLVAAGLTPFEALQTGTTAVAKFLGTNAGAVLVGRDADLVLLDANPLMDISNTRRVHGVMLRGKWYSPTVLENRLAAFVTRQD